MNYDIIGDVHGHASALEALLRKLGYQQRAKVWHHPHRVALFVGDLINRGPGQLATLNIVRAMVDGGFAQVVMGNHEYNAIAWATPSPEREVSNSVVFQVIAKDMFCDELAVLRSVFHPVDFLHFTLSHYASRARHRAVARAAGPLLALCYGRCPLPKQEPALVASQFFPVAEQSRKQKALCRFVRSVAWDWAPPPHSYHAPWYLQRPT